MTSLVNSRRIALFLILALPLLLSNSASAYSSLYTSRCASCHSDDSPTCNGCHYHKGSLSAWSDSSEYDAGSSISVTLDGGGRDGWIRGLLYDHNGTEVARVSGPTGTGDDGGGDDVIFPVTLTATAPETEGTYIWQAAWYGGATSGSGHLESATPVTIHVTAPTSVPEWPGYQVSAWSAIKALY